MPSGSVGSTSAATQVTASTTRMPSSATVFVQPSLQVAESETTGRRPPSVAVANQRRTLAVMAACPWTRPLDDHGVPQQWSAMPSGTTRATPARSASASTAGTTPSCAPSAPGSGANMLLWQDGR